MPKKSLIEMIPRSVLDRAYPESKLSRQARPASLNGCVRCPPGKETPCDEPRHMCPDCAGLGVIGLVRLQRPKSCSHPRVISTPEGLVVRG